MATKLIPNPKRVRVEVYDTLRTIAARELGDQSAWYKLVDLNNLRPPYITPSIHATDRQPHTLVFGDWIKLPISDYKRINNNIYSEDLFGQDILLDDYGNLSITASGDLELVSGTANLSQSISNRIRCHLGQFYIHKDYGSTYYLLVGTKNVPLLEMFSSYMLKAALEAEKRVAKVNSVSSTSSGDILYANASVTAVGDNTPFDLNLSYPISR